ncbi:MAG: FG-GAP-like repeat-containing protein [Desulfuromonadales bacterium]
MKRFFPTLCLTVVISLLLSVIWPSQSNAAAPIFTPLEQVRTDGLGSPGAVAVDAAGNFYVADADGGEVFKFNRYNRLVARFSLGASGNGLAVTPNGSMLYVSRSDEVLMVNPVTGDVSGVLAGSTSQAPEFGLVGDIEMDSDGNLYVADLQTKQIKIYDGQGRYRAAFGALGTGTGQFHQIGSMAISPDDKVVVADSSPLNGKVQVFVLNPVTLSVETVTPFLSGSAANFGAPAAQLPRGITFDDQGRGYLLDFLQSQIRVFSPVFQYLSTYSQGGVEAGKLAAVSDLAFDPSTKRLFITCDGGRIVLLGVDGGDTPVSVNHPPTAPVQQNPVGSSEVAVASPLLQYAAATDQDGDAISYRVIVLQGETVIFEAQTAETSISVPADRLAENAAYGWTVEAFDNEGAGSGATSPATFVVNAINEPPSAPVLMTPLKGEVLAGNGRLDWEPSTDPDPNDTLLGYQIEVAADATFGSPVLSARTSETEIVLADFAAYADLVDGGHYFWRAAAIDSDDLMSVPGAVGSFVYDTAVLKVAANMPGASVYLGGNHAFAGRYVGVAPLELRDLAPGALSVVVERHGFEPYVTQVTIAAADNAVVNAFLEPALQPVGLKMVGNGINGRSGLTVNGAAAPFLADFDNDGQLDLLVGDAAGQLTLFPAMQLTSRGQLDFQPGKGLGLPVMPGAVPFIADWDGDGRKDLLVGQADGTVKLFLNTGSEAAPAFGAAQDLTVASSVLNVGGKAAPVVIDLNGDGARDLVVGSAAGQVLAFFSQGTDVAAQLTAPVLLAEFSAAAVPASVDWDADGRRDLLVTVNGQSIPLRNDLAATGTFVAGLPLPVIAANAAFPLDIDGVKGKDLLVGQADGKLAFWAGNGTTLTAAALAGLLVKVNEVEELVAAEAPALLSQVDKIRQQITAGSLGGAVKTASSLADRLPVGDAKNATGELVALCR